MSVCVNVRVLQVVRQRRIVDTRTHTHTVHTAHTFHVVHTNAQDTLSTMPKTKYQHKEYKSAFQNSQLQHTQNENINVQIQLKMQHAKPTQHSTRNEVQNSTQTQHLKRRVRCQKKNINTKNK